MKELDIKQQQRESFLKGATTKDKGAGGYVKDAALSLLADGVVGVGEAAVGLANIPTLGRAGKFLEDKVGYDPKATHEFIGGFKTEKSKEQLQDFTNTEGFGGKLNYARNNPSLIVNTVAESLPSMFAGGAIGRGLGMIAPKVAPVVAGALGEGAVGAGMQAESIRQQTEDGLLTPKQTGIAAATGVTTAGFGYAGGRLAKKLGIGDFETIIAGGGRTANPAASVAGSAAANTAKNKGILRRGAEGALTEGLLEELPQSVSETILQNEALGRSLDEGVTDAAALGLLSGAAMGAGSGIYASNRAPTTDDTVPIAPTEDMGQEAANYGGSNARPNPNAPRLGFQGQATNQFNVDTNGEVFASDEYNDYLESQQELARQARNTEALKANDYNDVTPVPQDDGSLVTPAEQQDVQAERLGLGAPNAADFTAGQEGEVYGRDDVNTRLNQEREQAIERRDRIARGEILDRTPVPEAPKPSELMGLDANKGSLSAAAVLAVDSGASDVGNQMRDVAAQEPQMSAWQSGMTDRLANADPNSEVYGRLSQAIANEPVSAPEKARLMREADEIPKLDADIKQIKPNTRVLDETKAQTKAYTPEGAEVQAQWDVVDASDLITSNTDNFTINPDFPASRQPRDRTRAAAQLQVNNIASKLQPNILGESPDVSTGAPFVGASDNVVDSGNGRSMAIRKVYQENGEKAQEYRQFVNEQASKFGLDTDAVNMMQSPVLVRRNISDMNRDEFARAANKPTAALMSSTEQAATDAKNLPDASLLSFNSDGNMSLYQSQSYLKNFIAGLPETEQGSLMDESGALSREGKNRIEAAIIQDAYKNPKIVSAISEKLDSGTANVLRAITDKAPQISQLNSDAKSGDAFDNTLARDIADATQAYMDIKNSDKSVNDYLSQDSLLDDGLTDGAKEILTVLSDNKRSAKAIGEDIQQRINAVTGKGNPKQTSMFDDELESTPNVLSNESAPKQVATNTQAATQLTDDNPTINIPAPKQTSVNPQADPNELAPNNQEVISSDGPIKNNTNIKTDAINEAGNNAPSAETEAGPDDGASNESQPIVTDAPISNREQGPKQKGVESSTPSVEEIVEVPPKTYAQVQNEVADEMGITTNEDGEYDITDAQFDAMEGRVRERMEAQQRESTIAPKSGEPKFSRATGLSETAELKDLVVVHNITSKGILAAAELGGLAAPSIAVIRANVSDFTGYGEITLIADPLFLDGKDMPTYDADIYSPRQPRAQNNINEKRFNAYENSLSGRQYGLRFTDSRSLEMSDGEYQFMRSDAVQYKFLESIGKAPKLKNKVVDPLIKKASKLEASRYDLFNDPKFMAIATQDANQQIEKQAERAMARAEFKGQEYVDESESLRELYFDGEDGTLDRNLARAFMEKVLSYRDSDGKDFGQLKNDISEKMRSPIMQRRYEKWAEAEFSALSDGKRLPAGETRSGTRKYIPYNLENVVKEMTRELNNGENFSYGAGSVRSVYANPLKNIEAIKASREKIVSKEAFEKIKDESNEVFGKALDDLKQYYKFDADSWNYMNDAASSIAAGQKEIREIFGTSKEAKKIIDNLTSYLSQLPTEYFEAKAQRAVQFDEFNTAIVSKDADPEAVKVLKDAGVKIKRFDSKVDGDRNRVIAQQTKLMFSKPESERAAGTTNNQVKGATTTTRQQVIAKLSDRFGKETVQSLLDKNLLDIKTLSDFVVDGKLTIPNDVDGLYHNGKATLIADNLSDDMIIPTFLHELGGHGGLQTMMSDKTYNALMKDFDALVASGDPIAMQAKAMADKVARNQQEANDEYLPYLLTLTARQQGKQGKVAGMINRMAMAIRSWLRDTFGVNLKVNSQDVLALAERMVNEREKAANSSNQEMAPQFSNMNVPAKQLDDVRAKFEGTKDWMKAPNGQPTNLSEQQWLQVRTPAFKEWFGDWQGDPESASKIVDDQGEPLILYRGDNTLWNEYDLEKQGSNSGDKGLYGQGVYLTPDISEALDYGTNVREFYANGRNLLDLTNWRKAPIGNELLMELATNAKRFTFPEGYSYADFKKEYTELRASINTNNPQATGGEIGIEVIDTLSNKYRNKDAWFTGDKLKPDYTLEDFGADNVSVLLQKMGYDGATGKSTLRYGSNELEYMLPVTSQVKSATDNTGTFDPNNNDIRYSNDNLPAKELDAVREKYEGTDQWMKAPNGEKSNLNEQQWLQVRTKSFKDWFGDWEGYADNASEIIDDNSEPMVVYHGTKNLFNEFDLDMTGSATDQGTEGRGFYFISSIDAAQSYANSVGGDNDSVIGAFLSIKDPYKVKKGSAPRNLQNDAKAAKKFTKDMKKQGYDGVEYTLMSGIKSLVAFDSNQIKSATNNAGTFDGSNPDIRFSRAAGMNDQFDPRNIAKETATRIYDWASSAPPGKLSWWHKTIGTMYNLSQRNPAFKPVFEATEKFINDVSYYASKASELAPRLLPQLDSLRDITKSAIGAKDNEALSKPIFEGTLLWGRDLDGKAVLVEDWRKKVMATSKQDRLQLLKDANKITPAQEIELATLNNIQANRFINDLLDKEVVNAGLVWTDKELTDKFNLDDKQIGLYKEFRAATDNSLDSLTRSDMLRRLGKNANDIESQVMEAPTLREAVFNIEQHINSLIQASPKKEKALKGTLKDIKESQFRTNKLKDDGYAPLSRFGQYTVDVVDASGNREYFGMFESAYEARKMNEEMKALYSDPTTHTVTQGALSQEEFKLFAGVTPETAELFGEMLGLDATGDKAADEAFQEYLKRTKNNRSAMKRLMHRKGIKGYSEDVGRVLASFIYSNARHTSAALNMGNIDRSIQEIPKGEGQLKDAAVKLADYIKNPQEEAQLMRGWMFAQYLGGSIASAVVNITQPIAVSFPYLSQFGGATKAATQLGKASSDWTKAFASKNRDHFEYDLLAAIERAEADGTLSPQEVHNLLKQAAGKNPLSAGDGTKIGDAKALAGNSLSRVSLAWGALFSGAEQINRRVTFVAAYRMAVEQGMDNPADFATKSIKETQFVYNKASRMNWARGSVGGTLMTFKTYTVSYIELMHRLWNQGEKGSQERAQGRKATMLMLGVMFMLSGSGGLPFMEDAEDLIDGIGQIMGYNLSSKKARQDFLDDWFGEMLGDFLESGASSLPGSPTDVSGRLGLGNLIPGTGIFRERTNNTRDVMELAGPAGDFAGRIASGTRSIAKGAVNLDGNELKKGALEFAPTAVRNAVKGISMGTSGIYKDTKGYKVTDVSPVDAAFKFAGFQPLKVSKIQEANYLGQTDTSYYTLRASNIRALWAAGVVEGNQAKIADARAAVKDWNNKNPRQKIVIKPTDIARRVREMKMDKSDRIAKKAPKSMRGDMQQSFSQVRDGFN